MMPGKHAAHAASPKPHRKALFAVIGILSCIAIVSAGFTFAWYSGTSSILNPFTKGAVDVDISEEFDPAIGKSNVAITVPANDAAVDVYVRANVDIYWQDANGNRLWETPIEKNQSADYDYGMVWCAFGKAGTPDAWVTGADGFYYWTSPVASGASTDPLIMSCTQTIKHDDGRILVVDIATQAIQANPIQAFNESWSPYAGLTADDSGVLISGTVSGQGGAA